MPTRRKTTAKKSARKKKRAGKPSRFGNGAREEFLTRLAGGAESITDICRDDHMPSVATVLKWRADDEAFRSQYETAKAAKAETFVDQAIKIADKSDEDEGSARSSLRVATRKWAAGKYAPATYGDRTALDVGGQPDNPLTFAELVKRAQG